MMCYRKILRILCKDHVTNDETGAKILQAIGLYENLLTTVKRRKLNWYGHVSRSSDLAKTILQGTVKGERRLGTHKKRWEDNLRLAVRQVPDSSEEQRKMEETGCEDIYGAPMTIAVDG